MNNLSKLPTKCTNCESDEIIFFFSYQNNSSVQNGQLRITDLSPVVFLGCDECGETLGCLQGDEVIEILKRALLESSDKDLYIFKKN